MPIKGTTNNPAGRPKGIVNERVKQWESLADAITGKQAARFEEFMDQLWDSEDPKDHYKAAQLFMQALEYFRPKQARITNDVSQFEVVQIIAPDNI
jgi:hypothetical protein